MKKVLISFAFLLACNFTYANESDSYTVINDKTQVYYASIGDSWTVCENTQEDNVLVKEYIEGAGSHSIYRHLDNSIAFALATDCEIIKNGKMIVIDNNLLKYSKIIYNGEGFEQIPLTDEEIQEIFPDAEIFKVSSIDSDNKTWLHKPLFKKKSILLVNDIDRYFHQINYKFKDVQNPDIKGLITFNRYGIFTFKHLGERNGKLIFYIR